MVEDFSESLLNVQRLSREAGALRVKMPDGFTARIEGRDIVIEAEVPVKPEWWTPTEKQARYATIGLEGRVHTDTWTGSCLDRNRAAYGNVFPTIDAGEREARRTAARRRLQQFADHLNPEGWEPHWGQGAWMILHIPSTVLSPAFRLYAYSGAPMFHTREKAEQAYKWMQEDGLIEDYFGITKETS